MNWISLISIGISLLITGFNAALWIVVKFNDLAHLEKSVKELTETLKETNNKLVGTAERIAKIEGKCTANHG
jgi:hypothetical protein